MSKGLYERLRHTLGTVRLRQIVDHFKHRLSFVPGLYVIGLLLLAQILLLVDRELTNRQIPQLLATTVDSARSVFTAIAGGLITSITLLLSMILITVQLASSQFSPRTLRDWLGNTYLKHTVGLALGTTVFSLLALRATRSSDANGAAIIPHTSVIVAVALGVVSLFGVVRSVDHVTASMQIGSVASRIAADTIAVVEAEDELAAGQRPTQAPSTGSPHTTGDGLVAEDEVEIPDDALAIEALKSGWVQQIRPESILERLPEKSTGYVAVPLGSFVPQGTPLMWVSPAPAVDHPCRQELLNAFALGETRTLQQDIGFGILQLTDIAVRALSPGVNDPSTANDIIVHLGDVMLSLWAQPLEDGEVHDEGRTLIRRPTRREEHLRRAFDPIRRYGSTDPTVMLTLVRTLQMIAAEAERRSLAGSSEALTRMIDDVIESADGRGWASFELGEFEALSSSEGRSDTY